MKRKFLALLCVLAMVLALASCDVVDKLLGNDEPQDETCEHTYSDKWSTNSTEHWHAATCEHAELKADVANHTDADENGKCDVCDLEIGHEHTYADTWTSNDTHHWKVATCSHTEEKGELAAHVDADSNGECDVCSSHVHVLNLYGDCTVCGEHVTDVDITDINVILPIILSNTGKVNGGTITAGSMITDLELEGDELVSYFSGNMQEVVYTLGNGSAYYKVDTLSFYGDSQYTDTQETWYELLADGSVFGVYQYTYDGETGDFEVDGTASADSLVGFYYSVSTLADAYGAENLLAALYALSQSASASDYQFGYDEEDGAYAFVFNYMNVNSDTGEGEGDHVDYYEVMVYFYASENGVLTDLGVVCNCYTNSLEDELDNDYTYDQNAGTITMKDTAVADVYTFVITQTEGERTYVSEHSKSDFFPESFDAFVDEDLTTELGETATVTEGDTLTIYFGNFLPETTSAKYIMDTFTAIVDEENVIYWAYDGTASFISNVPGTYPVQFTLGNETFSFTLVVEEFVPDVTEQPENSVAVDITKDDTYAWSAVASFTAPADGDYTFYIPVGYGAWDKAECDNNFSGTPYVDLYNLYGGTFTVSVKEGETYEFYVSYVEVGVVYITYTVDDYTGSDDDGEGDDGVASEVVAGSYLGSNPYRGESTLVIDTANGTVSMDGQVFTYTFENGVMTIYLNGNAMPDYMLGVTLGSDGVPTAFVNNGNTYTVIGGGAGDDGDGDDTVETVVEGTYTGSDMYGNAFLTVTVEGNNVIFIFNHPMMGPSTLNTTYAFVDGELVLYNEDGSELHPLAGSLTVDATGTPVSASYNGNDYTLTVGGSSEGGDDENAAEAVTGYYTMDGYEVIISQNYEVEGAYVFNAWNGTADIYYDLTVVDNGDGSYTLVLSLVNPEEDVFGFLSEEFTVYVYGEYDKVLYGPAIEVEIPDYEDITLGTHTITITTEIIDGGYVIYDFVAETDGFYSVTGITAIFSDAYDNYYGVDFAYLTAGNYVLKLSVWDAVEGDLEFTLANASLDSLTALQYLAAASGEYNLGELTYSIYTYGDDVYCVNIYNSSTWSPDVYYIVTELVKNDDGSISFVLALDSDVSDSDDFGFAGTTVTISYDDGFVLTHDVPLRVTQGTFVGTDDFGNAFLTIVIDDTTVTFTFEHPMFGPSTNVATYEIVDGAVVLYDELGDVLNPLAGAITINENGLPVAAAFNGTNYSLVAEGAEDDNTDDGLQVGENYVQVLDGWMGTDYTFTAPESGTYNIYPGYGAMVGYDFTAYYFGETITVYLEAGQTIILTALTEDKSTGEISIYIELGSSDIGGSTGEPDGSASNPYVIEELPTEITFVGWHDVYYNFVATEDCTLTITYTEGSYVSSLINFDKDDVNNVYTVYCTAGEVIEINVWTSSPMDVTYTYTISYAA